MLKDIQQQKQYKILLIGEACEDVYVYGSINRISPEAPVPVLKKESKEKKSGMAGNVLNNLKSITGDNFKIYSYFNDAKLIKKIRFVDNKSKYQVMRYDIEKDIHPLDIETIENQNYDAVVISDYNKGFLPPNLIGKIIKIFKNSKIFVDTKKRDLAVFKDCILKINKAEKENSFNFEKNPNVIVTLGSEGCLYKNKIYKTKKVDVYDVCGAGDVFLASLVVGWLEKGNIVDAINVANSCAALSVTKSGCYTVSRKEYEKSLCV